jgi:Ulp1 family protease
MKIRWAKNVIKQSNNYDCGVYTAGNIERVLQQLQKCHKINNQKIYLLATIN